MLYITRCSYFEVDGFNGLQSLTKLGSYFSITYMVVNNQEFNAGLFDYLIATDDTQTKEKDQDDEGGHVGSRKSKKHPKAKLDSEFGVVRGIDFKNVHTVR